MAGKGEEGNDGDTQDYAVPAEDLEAMPADVAHEESDSEDTHDERHDNAHAKDAPFGGGQMQAVQDKCLDDPEQAPAKHDRDSEEEREFCSRLPAYAEDAPTENSGATARGSRNDGQTLEQTYTEGPAQAQLVNIGNDIALLLPYDFGLGLRRLQG